MINWFVAALQLAPIAITCPPDVSIYTRPKAACLAKDGQILTPPIRFTPDHQGLHSRSRSTIDAVAKILISQGIEAIEIHTHDRVPDRYGYRKTARQGKALFKALVARGVSSTGIKTIGFGESRPMTSRTDPSAAWVNTRVEIWLVGLDVLRVR